MFLRYVLYIVQCDCDFVLINSMENDNKPRKMPKHMIPLFVDINAQTAETIFSFSKHSHSKHSFVSFTNCQIYFKAANQFVFSFAFCSIAIFVAHIEQGECSKNEMNI